MDEEYSKQPAGKSPNRNSRRVVLGPEWTPLPQAIELLREHDVPGFGNRESARQRIVIDDALPHKMVGRRHYVDTASLHALIGAQPSAPSDSCSEDQRLVRYFQEEPTRDAVSAVADGIARSLVHAQVVLAAYRSSPSAAAAAGRRAGQEARRGTTRRAGLAVSGMPPERRRQSRRERANHPRRDRQQSGRLRYERRVRARGVPSAPLRVVPSLAQGRADDGDARAPRARAPRARRGRCRARVQQCPADCACPSCGGRSRRGPPRPDRGRC